MSCERARGGRRRGRGARRGNREREEQLEKVSFERANDEERVSEPTHKFMDGARVHLEVQVARDRVLPADRERLDVLLLPRGQLVERHLGAVRLHAEPGRLCPRRAHPHVRVRRVPDLGAHGERLERRREDVEHDLARDEGRAAERDLELVARAVVVAHDILLGRRHLEAVERRHLGRVALVQRCVDVPPARDGRKLGQPRSRCYSTRRDSNAPVEASEAFCRVLGADLRLMEALVARVLELARVGEPLQDVVVGDEAVADELHGGLRGDVAQVRVEDARRFGAADLSRRGNVRQREGSMARSLEVRASPFGSRLRARLLRRGSEARRTLPWPYSCAAGSKALVRACWPAGVTSTSSKTTTPCLYRSFSMLFIGS